MGLGVKIYPAFLELSRNHQVRVKTKTLEILEHEEIANRW